MTDTPRLTLPAGLNILAVGGLMPDWLVWLDSHEAHGGALPRQAVIDAGAVTWGNGNTGITGTVNLDDASARLTLESGGTTTIGRERVANPCLTALGDAPEARVYRRFDYRHSDVMGSGRYFYASKPKESALPS